MFICSDFLLGDPSVDVDGSDMVLYSEDGISQRYSTAGGPTIGSEADPMSLDKYRVLYYGRFSGDVLASGTRVVPCLTADLSAIFPLVEVHQPELTYDQASNILTLTFWTHFKDTWIPPTGPQSPGDGYDPTKIFQQYDPSTGQWTATVPDGVHRVQCVAVGSIQKFFVQGGHLNNSGDTTPSIDYVPLFRFPKVLQPVANWTDVPPYPGNSTPDTVVYEKQGPATIVPGSPLLPILGTSAINPTTGNLILKSPADFSDADGIDASPFFYIHVSFNAGSQGPQTGIARWPAGTFQTPLGGPQTSSLSAGQAVGVIHGDVAFVPGSAGARCVAFSGPQGTATLVRDPSAVLIRATGNINVNRQKVQVLADDNTLSGIDINAFDPPIQGPQTGGTFINEGPQGPAGPSGGPPGPQGAQGPEGEGVQGDIGDTGPTGLAGPQGFTGFQGFFGFQGVQGPIGPSGLQGSGVQGATGTFGPQGPSGSAGATGPTGPTGATGGTGPAGTAGPQGFQGVQGPQSAGGGGTPCYIVQDLGAGSIMIDIYANGYASAVTQSGVAATILNQTHPILAAPGTAGAQAFVTTVNGINYVDQGILEFYPGKINNAVMVPATGIFTADVYANGLGNTKTLTAVNVYSINSVDPSANGYGTGDEIILIKSFGGTLQGAAGGGFTLPAPNAKWYSLIAPNTVVSVSYATNASYQGGGVPTGTVQVDGPAVSAGQKILLANQGVNSGVWVVTSSGNWTKNKPFNPSMVLVTSGNTWAGLMWFIYNGTLYLPNRAVFA